MLAVVPLLLVGTLPSAGVAAPLAHREVLPSGVRLLVAPRPAIPIVVVRAYVRAGSVFDPPDAPGLANLTAELLTRGTAARTGPELDRAIEFVGGSLESESGRDGSTLTLAVLRKDLDLGLDLLAEVTAAADLPRGRAAPQGLGHPGGDPALRGESGGGRRARARPAALPRAPVCASGDGDGGVRAASSRASRWSRFHRARYRPDATVIAVVGDVARGRDPPGAVSPDLADGRPRRAPDAVIPLAPTIAARRRRDDQTAS